MSWGHSEVGRPHLRQGQPNNPLLWCVGTDAKNPDIMEVRVKINGSVGAAVATAIKPAWVWSNMWDSLTPD